MKHKSFEYIIIVAIITNSIILAISTYMDKDNIWLIVLDTIFTIIFTLEFLMKSIALGFISQQDSYIRDNWNKLDFIIVISSLIDLMFKDLDLSSLQILRLFRTLRPLRFISHNIGMKLIV